jgi:4-hydroxybenzoate polyprenyltransferase
VKNGFVLAAVVFAKAKDGMALSWDGVDERSSLTAAAAFCLGASAIYLVNDVLDVEADRRHPEKCKRPIAAGEVAIPVALIAAVICAVGALLLAQHTGVQSGRVTLLLASYVGLNIAYSLRLKHIVLVDAFCIAAGFLLRVEAGGAAAESVVSRWLLLCTFFLALFLALCKRRAECDLLGDRKAEHRKILGDYEVGFLDQMVTLLAACTILCYALYTVIGVDPQMQMVWTVPFVVFGLGRYMWLVQKQRGGGSPTRILLGGDPMFVLNTVGWMVATGWLLFR